MKDNCALLALTPSYAAARLYNVAIGQIPCTTEGISSFVNSFFLQKKVQLFEYVTKVGVDCIGSICRNRNQDVGVQHL